MKQISELFKIIKSEAPYELDKIRMYLNLLEEEDWKPINKSFIVSTGRTGTKFFARFLNKFPDFYAVHEPTPDFLDLAIKYARGLVDKKIAIERIRHNRRALAKDVKRKGASNYVESNNRYFSLISLLDKVFDDFKIIHIIRDGRDYVRSGIGRVWYTDDDTDPRMKAKYFPDDEYYDQWDEMSRFEKICWRWQKKDGFIYDQIQKMDNVITVKFEDIFKDEAHSGLYKICEQIDLDKKRVKPVVEEMMNRKVNSTGEYEIPKWSNWDQKKKDKFDEIAGEHMKKYYDYSW
ncbi:MAG: sulfotransferase family protein [Bacillota bacterium]